MHELTRMIREDMVPALGVTEPGAIAFCAAKARSLIGGKLIHLQVKMNSGIYKNAHTCCIPNSEAFGSVELALGGAGVDAVHGINGATPEETMRNMGLIASPGMTRTEETIVAIQQGKRI